MNENHIDIYRNVNERIINIDRNITVQILKLYSDLIDVIFYESDTLTMSSCSF